MNARSARSCIRLVSHTSALDHAIPARMPRPWPLSKKLPHDAEGAHRPSSCAQADRDLVPRRSKNRPEEWSGASMGQARQPPAPTGGPTLRECLSVRGDLSGPRCRRGSSHAIRRHRSHAGPSRRDQPHRSSGGPCRSSPRPRRVAHHRKAEMSQETHPDPPAVALSRTEPGREHLAIHARQLALKLDGSINRVFWTATGS